MKLLTLLLLLWLPFHLSHAQAEALAVVACGKKPVVRAAAKKAQPAPRKQRAATPPTRKSQQAHKTAAGKTRPAGRSLAGRGKAAKFARLRPIKRLRGVKPAPIVITDLSQPPALQSHAALVLRHDTGEVLYAKNASQPHAIASVTKLMTAIVVMDQALAMDELIRVSEDDVDTLKNSSSRLPVGTALSREELLLLALMSSENRAASALARTSLPGGLPRFVAAMNRKAQALGMRGTQFRDPTGLNPGNISTAADLAKMAQAAYQYPLIRRMTTTPEGEVYFSNRFLPTEYRNTNSLVRNQLMAVGLSKTGYIREAGRCLVMQANLADDPYLLIFLGSPARSGPAQDALKLERWLHYRRQTGG